MSKYSKSLVIAVSGLMAVGSVFGAALVRNPSFESNFNDVWPHYSSVDDWSGASGVNDLELDPTGPFHNAGTPVPDRARVGFKQGGGDVAQEISGLEPGGTYWLQFFYDGRAGGGASEAVVVLFNDTEIGRDANLKPSAGGYYFMNAPFTADADTGTIRFTHIVSGDRTLLLDGVTVVARSTNDIALRNPSFEASGILPSVGQTMPLAGWTQSGSVGVDDGTGGRADNGTPPDQDLVAFIEGAGLVSQPVEGMIIGTEYEVRLAVNAKTGTAPRLEVRMGETTLLEREVPPTGYQNLSVKFTASASDALLTLLQTREGTDTLLVDNVRLLGVAKKPLPPMVFDPLLSEVSPGGTVSHALTIPAEAVSAGAVDIQLRLSNPAVGRLEGSGDDGILTLRFEAGVTRRDFAIESINRGTVSVVVVGSKIPVAATPAVNVVSSLVKNASFESSGAPAVPGYGPIVGWQGQGNTGINRATGPNEFALPFGDNGLVPDREQVAFIQGSGSLAQQINGLFPGRTYWLQFRYNARSCCEERSQTLIVRFAGTELASFVEMKPVADSGEVNYYAASLPLVAADSTGLLEFVHVVTGDATVVLDAVSIVARAMDEIPIQNPSFEASGSPGGVGYIQPFQIAGWDSGAGGRGINVDGEGPFSDNGAVPDQDRTLFIQNVGGSVSQRVSGLTVGQVYTLVFGVNGRNCCGAVPVARVSINDVPLGEEEVIPVGGRNPFTSKYLTFSADSTDALIKFEISGPEGADVSLLVDDVHLVPGARTPPSITSQPVSQSMHAGERLALAVTATGNDLRYEWQRNGIALADGGRIGGVSTPTLGIPRVLPSDAGSYRVLISDGLGVIASESAEVEVVVVQGAPTLKAFVVAAGVQLRWPSDVAGFRLQSASGPGGSWGDVTDPVTDDGSDNVVTVTARGDAAFFRLTE